MKIALASGDNIGNIQEKQVLYTVIENKPRKNHYFAFI